MEIRRIQWQQTIPLRHAVLWPGRDPAFCQIDGDPDAWHYGAFVAGELVCVASVYPDGEAARLRKFATAANHQGQGIGTRMLRHILAELALGGVDYFWCDARESAMGFYARFGLRPEGARFHKGEVPYYRMGLRLG
jgi:ribosomal protein S18 acetylase RimI-like enzyme